MISIPSYLYQHTVEPVPLAVELAAEQLIPKVKAMLADPDCPTPDANMTSGYRPPAVNAATPGAKPNSTHMSGHGIDIADGGGQLDMWLTDAILEQYGLYREHPSATVTWCHLQDVPPRSGHRTYFP